MKSVLISIQPKWCELIASGKKTVEVRKTKPKIETPFKVYIYETQGRTETPWIDEDGHEIFKGKGQVIGEFVCDDIDTIAVFNDRLYCVNNSQANKLKQMCLTIEEIKAYLGSKNLGYNWHISDLVIYDKPRKLTDFRYHCRYEFDDDYENCEGCYYYYYSNTPSYGIEEYCGCNGLKMLRRPPQSWCYVESED